MTSTRSAAPSLMNAGLYACPDTGAALLPGAEGGTLVSPSTGRAFTFDESDILSLLPEDLHQAEVKHREREGWQKVFNDHGWQVSPDTFRTSLGDLGRDDVYWAKVAQAFPFAEALLNPRPGVVGLDIACGFGWASWRFARMGARMTSLDFNDTAANGLAAARRGWIDDVRYDLVRGDAENLPLLDASYDFAFICSALHHMTRPHAVVAEVARVLKPGGLFVLLCEAIRLPGESREQEEEYETLANYREAGINELSYTQREYEEMLRQAGFQTDVLLPDWDIPLPGRPIQEWKWRNIQRGLGTRSTASRRLVASIACRPPFNGPYRQLLLHRRKSDRVLVARKPQ